MVWDVSSKDRRNRQQMPEVANPVKNMRMSTATRTRSHRHFKTLAFQGLLHSNFVSAYGTTASRPRICYGSTNPSAK